MSLSTSALPDTACFALDVVIAFIFIFPFFFFCPPPPPFFFLGYQAEFPEPFPLDPSPAEFQSSDQTIDRAELYLIPAAFSLDFGETRSYVLVVAVELTYVESPTARRRQAVVSPRMEDGEATILPQLRLSMTNDPERYEAIRGASEATSSSGLAGTTKVMLLAIGSGLVGLLLLGLILWWCCASRRLGAGSGSKDGNGKTLSETETTVSGSYYYPSGSCSSEGHDRSQTRNTTTGSSSSFSSTGSSSLSASVTTGTSALSSEASYEYYYSELVSTGGAPQSLALHQQRFPTAGHQNGEAAPAEVRRPSGLAPALPEESGDALAQMQILDVYQ